MADVFITGASEGIGLALAKLHLKKGDTVIGVSRHCSELLRQHDRFSFISCDFSCLDDLSRVIKEHRSMLSDAGIETIYLNAGVTGHAPEFANDVSLSEIIQVMEVNAFANKLLLDSFLGMASRPKQVVVSGSIAGRRYRAGMLAYSMSKAALEALCGVYAQENPDVFFAVLGMCNVDTKLSHNIVNRSNIERFPSHLSLKKRFQLPGYVVSAEQRAEDVYRVVHQRGCKQLRSGEFAEIRVLLNAGDENCQAGQ